MISKAAGKVSVGGYTCVYELVCKNTGGDLGLMKSCLPADTSNKVSELLKKKRLTVLTRELYSAIPPLRFHRYIELVMLGKVNSQGKDF